MFKALLDGNANNEYRPTIPGGNYGCAMTKDRHGNENLAYHLDGINDYISWAKYDEV